MKDAVLYSGNAFEEMERFSEADLKSMTQAPPPDKSQFVSDGRKLQNIIFLQSFFYVKFFSCIKTKILLQFSSVLRYEIPPLSCVRR